MRFRGRAFTMCDKDRGMCYSVCGMVHIKEPLLLIGMNNPRSVPTAGFLSRYLRQPLPYVRRSFLGTYLYMTHSVTGHIV